uniref:Transmembrane protein n=1 Tax=Hanusia phi TaxID=3032 RepID=A0A7S0EA66_9CRYP
MAGRRDILCSVLLRGRDRSNVLLRRICFLGLACALVLGVSHLIFFLSLPRRLHSLLLLPSLLLSFPLSFFSTILIVLLPSLLLKSLLLPSRLLGFCLCSLSFPVFVFLFIPLLLCIRFTSSTPFLASLLLKNEGIFFSH